MKTFDTRFCLANLPNILLISGRYQSVKPQRSQFLTESGKRVVPRLSEIASCSLRDSRNLRTPFLPGPVLLPLFYEGVVPPKYEWSEIIRVCCLLCLHWSLLRHFLHHA